MDGLNKYQKIYDDFDKIFGENRPLQEWAKYLKKYSDIVKGRDSKHLLVESKSRYVDRGMIRTMLILSKQLQKGDEGIKKHFDVLADYLRATAEPGKI